MARFQKQKQRFSLLCSLPQWRQALEENIANPEQAKESVNPLISLLNRQEYRWQAAFGLGRALALLAQNDMERARVIVRRFMWSLNEESGNIGWGIPEAMGCILAESPALAEEYGRIFLSYGYETGKDDNFLDHGPLRSGLYWGIGRLAQANPEAARPALPHLLTALKQKEREICGMAAWAILQLARSLPDAFFAEDVPRREWQEAAQSLARTRKELEDSGQGTLALTLFDGTALVAPLLVALPEEARAAIEERLAAASAM